MKTSNRILQIAIAIATIFAMPHLASGGTSFTYTMTPSSDNAVQGTATALTYTPNSQGLKASASGTYTGGWVTNSYTIAYSSGASASPGITIAFGKNPFFGSANPDYSSVTVNTFAGTTAGTYSVTFLGTNSTGHSATAPYTLTVAAPGATGPGRVWTPAGVNTNWSTASNWTPNQKPASTNDVEFYDLGGGAAAGTVDNVVDTSSSIGSLTYGQTNVTHTTQINPGMTLTVGGDTIGLNAGTGTAYDTVTTNSITGAGGTLAVTNTSTSVTVDQSDDNIGAGDTTLDLSGLGVFNATISNLWVGVDNNIKGANGILNLAGTNTITLTPGSTSPQIDIGDNSQANGVTATNLNILLLGKTNAFSVDSIEIGRGRTGSALMAFNSAFSSPSAYFFGTNGTASRVGTWYIADGNTGKSKGTCHATNDFSLGTVNASVNTMYVGVGSSATGADSVTGAGVLNVSAGIINVNNLNVGLTMSATNPGAGLGTVNFTGGTLVVNTNLVLAAGATNASGTLNFSSATLTANNGITVGSGVSTISLTSSTLNATNTLATLGTTNNPVNSFSIAGSTMNLALQNGAPSIATTNLAVGAGPNTINISSVPLLTGFPAQFQAIQYGINGGSASGSLATFALGTLPPASPIAYGAYLSNNVMNKSIDIVFTNGPSVPVLTWDGTNNGNWNISTTANWRPNSGPDTVYIDTAFVTFDDSLRGTPTVNLTTTLMPGSLTIANTHSNYVFTGSGSISGGVGLNMTGTGLLTLDNSGVNNFSGGVNISSGTLQVGNNDANGNLPAGSIIDNGALIFARSDANVIVPDVISGTGTLTQNGAAADILTLAASNTAFAGAITVLQGTLQAGTSKAFGTNQTTGSITITNAATLDVNAQKFGPGNALPITVSGSGLGGNGAIVNNSSNQSSVLFTVTLAGNTTIGGSGNWDIRNSSITPAAADGQLNDPGGFNLTKVGTNTITLTSLTVDTDLENINVQAGALDFANLTTSLGDPNATVTVYTNATLVLDSLANVLSKVVVLNSGGILKGSGTNSSGGPVTFAGPVTLLGAGQMTANTGALFLLQNTVSGAGSLSKIGSGTVFLAASNTYSGSTTVSGTLALTNYNGIDGSITLSTNINVTSGATLDVLGRSDQTLTLVSGQTLEGGGSGTNAAGMINGSLTSSLGATVATGTGNTNMGTLSVNGTATLSGATVMKISAAGGNDQIDATAFTTTGGTLQVNIASGTITNGQTFQLFVATNGYTALGFSGGVTLPSAPGLTWANNLTSNGSITATVVAVPPTPPDFTGVSVLSPTQFVISGTSSTTNLSYTYTVLSATNLASPLSAWVTNSTGNAFNPGGNFRITNTVTPNLPQTFFRIRVP